jgi:plasmid stability protein
MRRMGQIVVRNLDGAVIAALKRRAAAAGTSTEEQARRALAHAVGLDREAALKRLDEVRQRIGRLPGPSLSEIIRQERDREDQ